MNNDYAERARIKRERLAPLFERFGPKTPPDMILIGPGGADSYFAEGRRWAS